MEHSDMTHNGVFHKVDMLQGDILGATWDMSA